MTIKNKKERINYIIETLDHFFPEPGVPLLHKDPYTLLISVLLSAQCTDERVNRISPLLFALADTPKKMSLLEVNQIQDIIKPCGLSSRKSKAIKELSIKLLTDFQGRVPADIKLIESLPGVGHKTASVVISQAFGISAFPVDTHIHRLASRWGLSNGKNVVQTELDLKKVFPESLWNKIHIQIILYGRKFCPARGHDINKCPICYYCKHKMKIQKG